MGHDLLKQECKCVPGVWEWAKVYSLKVVWVQVPVVWVGVGVGVWVGCRLSVGRTRYKYKKAGESRCSEFEESSSAPEKNVRPSRPPLDPRGRRLLLRR